MSEDIYNELRKLSADYAEAEADRVYLTEFRKSKKAILMKNAEVNNPGMSAAAQEREAYSNIEYISLLDGLKSATEKALYIRHRMKVVEMQFEAWRTKQATARAEMNLR